MPHSTLRLCVRLAAGLTLLAAPRVWAQDAGAPPLLRGDVNGDGQVTRADADAVRIYLVRGALPGGRGILPAGDANGDGRVTAADAALISRFAAGMDVSRFPVGKPIGGRAGGGHTGAAAITTDYECIVDLSRGTESCEAVARTGPNGAKLDLIAGTSQLTFANSWVHSYGSNVDDDTSTTTLSFTNNMGQPIGTTDGSSADPDGNRLFFSTIPYVYSVDSGTVAGATIRLVTPDDTASFTNPEATLSFPNRPYYQYDGVVAPGASSSSRVIRYIYSTNVKVFGYGYRVSTPVQYEYGWITISPATTPVLAPTDTTTLSGTVRNAYGVVQGDGITWSTSNAAVATVDSVTGKVTAVAAGTATITATSKVNAQRTGTRLVTVDVAPTVSLTSPADDATGIDPDSDIEITFSEAVDVDASSFTLVCSVGTSPALTVGGSGTQLITLTPQSDLPPTGDCQLTVVAAEVSDTDTNDGPDAMAANYVFNFVVANEHTWEGDVSTDWSVAGNWAGGVVPDSQSVVTVPASAPNMPGLTANVVILDLQTVSGSTLDLNAYTLRARGDVSALGTVSDGTLSLTEAGTLLQGNVPAVHITGSTSLQGATKASAAVTVSSGSLSVANQALSISVP